MPMVFPQSIFDGAGFGGREISILSPPPKGYANIAPFRQSRGPDAGPGGMAGGEGRLSGWGYECGSRTCNQG